jgi:pimeloyl-ACP methyl ester carboxylesterase
LHSLQDHSQIYKSYILANTLVQDLRNHGHSAHNPEHNYTVMAEDVENFIRQHQLGKAVLFGHSMYGLSLSAHFVFWGVLTYDLKSGAPKQP